MKNVTIIRKKHGYKVEYKGLIRYCTESRLEKVKRELLDLDGKECTEIYLAI